jgi:hypothetical protein
VAGNRYTVPSEVADSQALGEVKAVETGPFYLNELGVTGLKRTSGYIDEEFLPHLRGRKAVAVYREMGDNDPITGALLFTITQLLRGLDWTVVPGGKGPEATKAAKLLETAKDDMSETWDDFISECLTHLQYGWAWHEIIYKRRMGPWEKDPRHKSKYTDGLVGWRKMPIRAQETLQRWVFDETGGVQAMVQLAPPDYKMRVLPMSRSLLFRFGHHKNNPEGRSLLRNSYRPWYYKKRMEEFESVGVERDLAGLPMVSVPAEYMRAKPGTEQHKMVESMKKMVRSIRRNEQEGLVFPVSYDQDTKQPLFKFELLNSGGTRQHDTNQLIERYEQRQLMTVLADFIMVGHQGSTGTYNLHVDKTGIFREALNAVAKNIAEVLNRHAVPRLFAANGWRPAELPTLQPGDVDAPDLGQLAQFLSATAGLGFNWGPDADMEKWLRNAAGMPALGEADMDSKRKMARQDEAARMVETQTRYLEGRAALIQATAQEEQLAMGGQTPETLQLAQANAQQQTTDAQGAESHAQTMAQGAQTLQHGASEEKRTAASHTKDMKTPTAKPAAKAKTSKRFTGRDYSRWDR